MAKLSKFNEFVNESSYTPKPGSATSAVIEFLKAEGEGTQADIMDAIQGKRPDHTNKPGYNFAFDYSGVGNWNEQTMGAAIKTLMDKGVIEREQKKNEKSGRKAYFYKLK